MDFGFAILDFGLDRCAATNRRAACADRVHPQSKIRNPKSKIPAALVSLCFIAPTYAADVVHQRDNLPSVEGRVIKYDDAGVTVDRGEGVPQLIRWDLVRDVQLEKDDPAIEPFRELALNLWRARTRLERHDATLAEPLFERLFERYRPQTSETALLVAEGLLRCRIARGANDMAVIPALEAARLRRALNHNAPIFESMSPAVDGETWLCPALPPTWVNSPALMKLERDLASYHPGTDTVVGGLARLYHRAVRQQLALRIDADQPVLAAEHPGIGFMHAIVELHSIDSQRRDAARQSLAQSTEHSRDWMRAWSRYFVGMSLLRESDPAQYDRGLLHLVELPAQFSATHPYLTGLAITTLAQACDASGDTDAAASLRSELHTRFPNHPALAARGAMPVGNGPDASRQ